MTQYLKNLWDRPPPLALYYAWLCQSPVFSIYWWSLFIQLLILFPGGFILFLCSFSAIWNNATCREKVTKEGKKGEKEKSWTRRKNTGVKGRWGARTNSSSGFDLLCWVCVCETLCVLVCHTSAAATADTQRSAGVAEDRTAVRAERESRLFPARSLALPLFALTRLLTLMISRPHSYTHTRPLTGWLTELCKGSRVHFNFFVCSKVLLLLEFPSCVRVCLHFEGVLEPTVSVQELREKNTHCLIDTSFF